MRIQPMFRNGHASPINLGFRAFGVEVTSLVGDGPSIVGADEVHYQTPGFFPKLKDRHGRLVEIFAALPRTEAREEEGYRSSHAPGSHHNPYVVRVRAVVDPDDGTYGPGDYPDDALCLVVVEYLASDPAALLVHVLPRPLPPRDASPKGWIGSLYAKLSLT